LVGVRAEVQEQLLDRAAVHEDGRELVNVGDRDREGLRRAAHLRLEELDRLLDELAEVRELQVEALLPRLDLREREHAVDQAREAVRLLRDDLEALALLLLARDAAHEERLRE